MALLVGHRTCDLQVAGSSPASAPLRASYLHLCVSVTKQYTCNLLLVNGLWRSDWGWEGDRRSGDAGQHKGDEYPAEAHHWARPAFTFSYSFSYWIVSWLCHVHETSDLTTRQTVVCIAVWSQVLPLLERESCQWNAILLERVFVEVAGYRCRMWVDWTLEVSLLLTVVILWIINCTIKQ